MPGRTHCREPRDAWFYAPDQTCQKTVAGKVVDTAATYRYRTKEIRDPHDPYKVITIIVDKDGSLTSAPRGELHFDFCDSAPVQFNVATDFKKTEENRALACQAVYAPPAYRRVIKYTDGTYIEKRFKKVLKQSYDWDRAPIDVTSYTDWKVKKDTCSRLLPHHDVVKTKTDACTNAGDIGAMNYESLEKYYKQDFATYGYERTYESSHQFVRRGKWKRTANNCRYTTTTRVAGWVQGCGRDGGPGSTVTPPYTITTTTIWRDGRASTAVVTHIAATRTCGDGGGGEGSGGHGGGGVGDGGDRGGGPGAGEAGGD